MVKEVHYFRKEACISLLHTINSSKENVTLRKGGAIKAH